MTKRKPQQQDASESTRTLAEHLSAVIKHPELPDALQKAILDELCELESCVDYHTPDMLELSLESFKRHEAEKEEG